MAKVLVIGSESFLGKYLIEELMKRNDIHLSVSFRTPNAERLQFYKDHKITCYVGDLENYKTLLQFEKQYDIIYYLISATYPAVSWANPKMELQKNLDPFSNFMRYVSTNEIGRIAFVSSGGTVYGLQSGLLDETTFTKPFSPYGIFKLTMENLLEYLRVKEGTNYDVYRVSNIYGPGQNISKGLGVINIWLKKIIDDREVTVFGDGENIRDYIYVKDVAKLLTNSVARLNKESEIYNLGSGKGFSLNQLLQIIKEVVPYSFKINYVDARKSDNKEVIIDSKKLQTHFGGFSFLPIKNGIEQTFLSYTNKVTP